MSRSHPPPSLVSTFVRFSDDCGFFVFLVVILFVFFVLLIIVIRILGR
jgi:hypothetical protein